MSVPAELQWLDEIYQACYQITREPTSASTLVLSLALFGLADDWLKAQAGSAPAPKPPQPSSDASRAAAPRPICSAALLSS